MPRKQHLKMAGISHRTLSIYRREVSLFFAYVDFLGFKLPSSYGRLDQLVADYINHLYQEGETLTKAGWLLSGFKRLYPRVRRELAISQQWYNNWCREHTPRRATPITWHLVQAFTGLCIHLKWKRLAALLLVSFVFFLRTGESLELMPDDLLLSVSDGCTVVRLASSKTSPGTQQSLAHFDATLVVTLRALLVRALPNKPLWRWSLTHALSHLFHCHLQFL